MNNLTAYEMIFLFQALTHIYFYSEPYPSFIDLIKPPEDHRLQVKPTEVDTDVPVTTIFKNLLNIAHDT